MEMLTLDPDATDQRLRLAGFLVANQFLAAAQVLRKAFGLSHEDVLIVLTVALGNVQRMLRTPDAEGLVTSTALVAQGRIGPVSRRPVARATGLARETVRRRTAALVDAGVLLEWKGGLRTARRLVLVPDIRDAVHQLTELHAGTSRALLRENILV